MTILSFSSFNEYTNPSTAILANNAAIARLYQPLWPPVWSGTLNNVNLTVEGMPGSDDGENRNWLRMRAASNNGTTAYSRHLEFRSTEIDPSLKVPGSTLYLGYHFATETMYAPNTRAYLAFRRPANTLAGFTYPTGFLIGNNERRWIDIRVKFLREEKETVVTVTEEGQTEVENILVQEGTAEISVFVNRVLVETMTALPNQVWAIACGDYSNAIFRSTTATNGMAFNDFLLVQDFDDEPAEQQTGMIGPVKVRPLKLAVPQYEGRWQVPTGKTMQEALSMGTASYSATIAAADTILTDPDGKKLTSTFLMPEEESPILAMSESIVAQRPPSMAASLEWRRVFDGAPDGPVVREDFPNTLFAKIINMPIIVPKAGQQYLQPEDIESRGVTFNSVKTPVIGD